MRQSTERKGSKQMYIRKISKPKDAIRITCEADIPDFLRDTIHIKNEQIICLAAEGYNFSKLGAVIGYDRCAPTATGKGAWPLGEDSYTEKDGVFYSSSDIRRAWILSDDTPDELKKRLPLTRNEDGSWSLSSKWGVQTNRNEATKEILNALLVETASGDCNILSENTSSYEDYVLCTENGETICKLKDAGIFDRESGEITGIEDTCTIKDRKNAEASLLTNLLL